MIDLPTIVEAIRRQRPGVVPEWPTYIEQPYDKDTNFSKHGCRWYWMTPFPFALLHPMTEEAVESMLVGWLYSALMRKQSTQSTSRRRGHESCGVWIGPTNGHWYAKTGRLHAKAVDFGDGDLALVRALCHAIGIELPNA